MANRREFLGGLGAASLGVFGVPCTCGRSLAQTPPSRREVSVGGRRVRTIDIHCHCGVADVLKVVAGTDLERPASRHLHARDGVEIGPDRLAIMDGQGIDAEVLTINPWWYGADEDLARRIIDVQNQKLGEITKAYPGRIYAFASVSLQFPERAAEQLEIGMKQMGLKGAAIGCSVEGDELSAPKFDPFWAKAEELEALVFMHPQDNITGTGIGKRVRGPGALANVIGNPLETTFALSHLIFDGTLDRFPNLKLCGAHGGGFLPSYAARMDHGCEIFPGQCKGPVLKKKPTDYLKQLYFDSLVFTPEGLRHLVAQCGVGQIMVGTDTAIPWVKDPVGQVLETPELSDADRIAILGGTAEKLLKL
ncbi:MAG TPA: amidohydrolase family protein [Beijerinckiaceae bacterium]|jgi:aminocarboxymuconate-semialdehyde decarboxylase|nr:amidohydrolase family protein [Beijerinckiaceae bacterium]